MRRMSLNVGSTLPVLAVRCEAAVRVLVPSLVAVGGGVYVHVLYLGGVVGPWGYLAAAAAALAALFLPGGRRVEGLEALEYLYRWRRVCVAAAPLKALATAAMAALTALSVAVFLHPPHLLYAEVQESSAVGNLTFYTLRVVRAVPGGGPPEEGVVVLMVDGKVYMPFLWETAALLALAVGYTAAAASLVAFWQALGSSAEGVLELWSFMSGRGGFLPDVYVVARILHALMGGPRSRLAAVARVNYRRFQEYLQFLVERGYVTDGEVVSLTPRGAEVAAELERLLNEVLGRKDPFEKRRKQHLQRQNLINNASHHFYEQSCGGSGADPRGGGRTLLPIHSPERPDGDPDAHDHPDAADSYDGAGERQGDVVDSADRDSSGYHNDVHASRRAATVWC